MFNLNVATAMGLLKHMPDFTQGDFDAVGISESDFRLLTSETPWRRDQIRTVMRTLHALTYSNLEILGMPKITVPAEFQAAVIVSIVRPVNMRVACIWMANERQSGAPAQELANGQTSGDLAPVSDQQLYAMVAILLGKEGTDQVRRNMYLQFGMEYDRAAGSAVIQ